MKRAAFLLLAGIFLFTFMLTICAPVLAEEEPEKYSAEYWRNADWNDPQTDEEWDHWLENDPDLSVLFDLSDRFGAAYASYGLAIKLGDLFLEDPLTFIRALAEEEKAIRDPIVDTFFRSMYYIHTNADAFPAAINSITLTDEDSDTAHQLLQVFRDKIWYFADWESFDWKTLESSDAEISFSNWIQSETDLHIIFRIDFSVPDGAIRETVAGRLNELLLYDPLEYIRDLAQRDTAIQEQIATLMAEYSYSDANTAVPHTVYSLDPSDLRYEHEQQTLFLLTNAMAELWGAPNPKTGDPVGIFAVLLTLSATGAGVLLSRKNKF